MLLATVCSGCRAVTATALQPSRLFALPGAANASTDLRGPVEAALVKLLARHVQPPVVQASADGADLQPLPQRVCIVSVRDETPDGAGDLAARIRDLIEARLEASASFAPVDQAAVTATLRAGRLEPARLRSIDERRTFAALLEERGQTVDYLLFATVKDSDIPDDTARLELELLDARSGSRDEEAADLPALSRRRE
jgi:hypothetical protein